MTKSKKGVLKFVKKGDSSLMHGRATEGVLKFEKKATPKKTRGSRYV